MKLLMQHVQVEPTPPSCRTEQHIPRDIDDFVMACLNKDPSRRPSSAQELIHIACACKTDDEWDERSAKKWWEMHLPQLTTPGRPAAARGSGRQPETRNRGLQARLLPLTAAGRRRHEDHSMSFN
jgi:serine/threonine-protein kinase